MYTYLSIYLYLEHLMLHSDFDENLVEEIKEVMDGLWYNKLSEKDRNYLDSRPIRAYIPKKENTNDRLVRLIYVVIILGVVLGVGFGLWQIAIKLF